LTGSITTRQTHLRVTELIMDNSKPILVTGATGYVGGRLIPALLERGHRVRAMGRSAAKVGCRPWAQHPRVEIVEGDVLDAGSLEAAAAGCEAAYYLVHSMIAQKDRFAEADRTAARNMVAAAEAAGLKRIIYLGGLAEARSRWPRSSNRAACRPPTCGHR